MCSMNMISKWMDMTNEFDFDFDSDDVFVFHGFGMIDALAKRCVVKMMWTNGGWMN